MTAAPTPVWLIGFSSEFLLLDAEWQATLLSHLPPDHQAEFTPPRRFHTPEGRRYRYDMTAKPTEPNAT